MNPVLVRHVLVLGALAALGPLAIDMYLPSFPRIAHDLATDEGAVQFSLVSFFVALALGQAFWGPLSDMYGRKRPLLVGLGLFVLTSLGCALAASIEALTLLRFVQGLGASACMVISRAVIRDLYSGVDAARLLSLVLLVLGVSPIIAPLFGSLLLQLVHWPALFLVFAAFGIACMALVAFLLEETQPPARRVGAGFGAAFAIYRRLMIDRRFVGTVFVGGFAQAGMFAYLAGSPFVFMTLNGTTPVLYSVIFAVNAIGLIGGAQFNVRLIRAFGAEALIRCATAVYALAACVLLVVTLLSVPGLPALVLPLFVLVSCMGLIMPPSAMLAIDPHPTIAGTASSLIGTLQWTAAASSGVIVSLLFNGTALPMVGTIAVCALGAMVMARLILRPVPVPA
ncbi:Bcr/CflA family multidrug efflux MFS transporter [Marinivivus vitaminiproducens]|uniref:Bcr/CflA family multidrug efflux MFS transporter n=1 Tax=Marinivivus vitaminiproducens TaxID=3035935 RepID=UPI0027A105D6|nr:Bcr/CflA family multidrug efflux MFS transporter [Geminicoccaceae bacterium SCSIO 64248]